MPSSNKTKNLSLNSWVSSDKPRMADFNEDNSIIDQLVGGHIINDDIHLTSEQKAKAVEPYYKMLYSGNGEASRAFSLTVKPTLVFVYRIGESPVTYENNVAKINFAVGFAMYGASKGLNVSSSSVTVSQSSEAENGSVVNLNENGKNYMMVIFK